MQERQETWVRSLDRKDPLEEGMATHSSVLAWRIPWTEEPGRLWLLWSQTVGHNWATEHTQACTHTHTHTHTHTRQQYTWRGMLTIATGKRTTGWPRWGERKPPYNTKYRCSFSEDPTKYFAHLFGHLSFNKYLLASTVEPDIVLGIRNSAENQKDMSLNSWNLPINWVRWTVS